MANEFDCSVCLEIPDGPIYQCHEGHWFCGVCLDSLDGRCPECRMELTHRKIRNRALEQVIAKLPATCAHCGLSATRGKVADHATRECTERPVVCTAANAGCLWHGPLSGLGDHEGKCALCICRVGELTAELQATRAEAQRCLAAIGGSLRSIHRDMPRLVALLKDNIAR